jgi:DNA invertase Pin-like site-specific DNA recombinase
MRSAPFTSTIRCAVYTRKSTEEGLQQEFNSLDAQRESAEAYIRSQAHEGCCSWTTTTTMVASPVGIWSGRRSSG